MTIYTGLFCYTGFDPSTYVKEHWEMVTIAVFCSGESIVPSVNVPEASFCYTLLKKDPYLSNSDKYSRESMFCINMFPYESAMFCIDNFADAYFWVTLSVYNWESTIIYSADLESLASTLLYI